MELAMANRNLREGDYTEHEAEMLKVEEHLQECVPFMKRVKIIDFHLASPVNGSEASSDSLEM
jgi:broad-specificity NMP kinase